MIVTEIFYGLKCDRCGELHNDSDDHSYWNDEGDAIESAYNSEWSELNGRYYCPSCHKINEDTDEIKVYDEYPAHLKTLNKFLDRIALCTGREVSEDDREFWVKCNSYKKPKLDQFEVDYIESLLGDKFISLDYEQGRYNRITCVIKFKK